jgi:hypothetical protein
LLQVHQSKTTQAVLQLLGQGAAFSSAGWGWDCKQPRGFGLPAQLQPVAPLQAAETQLQALAVALLGLLKTARHQLGV